ncbi:helix-turn-helix domain protein [Solidesulfovibrio carbinoliphilus subsp. oakridgensis]|uniref:Helix-turn-helix domain protein n=1 Tax=Solidesulfovibrio carbinoliphilus subsp. oakridgensis TaxID=694327 RepID=G7Q6U8_9BACT|nr:helix-turn-helix transcriptional regulator [Solidesulfovibrio carbinoliphilus]EHJ48033.1 helix-turn-helix domain protein [Solidesulfovibrio carbinoliphilus subsp. oakridgensis]
MEEKIIEGSDNVFADLGLPDPEERAYKADLIMVLESIIKRRGLTQVETARLCGTDQGTLSKVLRGRVGLVSTDRLLRWIGCLGGSVRITVDETPDHVPGPVSVCFLPACP